MTEPTLTPDWLEALVWRWDRWRIRRLAARQGITEDEARARRAGDGR